MGHPSIERLADRRRRVARWPACRLCHQAIEDVKGFVEHVLKP